MVGRYSEENPHTNLDIDSINDVEDCYWSMTTSYQEGIGIIRGKNTDNQYQRWIRLSWMELQKIQ